MDEQEGGMWLWIQRRLRFRFTLIHMARALPASLLPWICVPWTSRRCSRGRRLSFLVISFKQSQSIAIDTRVKQLSSNGSDGRERESCLRLYPSQKPTQHYIQPQLLTPMPIFDHAHDFTMANCHFAIVHGDQNVHNNDLTTHARISSSTLPPVSPAQDVITSTSERSTHAMKLCDMEPDGGLMESPLTIATRLRHLLSTSDYDPETKVYFGNLYADLECIIDLLNFVDCGRDYLMDTPLRRNIERFLDPRLNKCSFQLARACRDIELHQEALKNTPIWSLWPIVYYQRWSPRRRLSALVSSLKDSLLAVQALLCCALHGLSSDTLKRLVTRSNFSRRSIDEYYAKVKSILAKPSIIRIHIVLVNILDYFGKPMGIPVEFCGSIAELHAILKRYSESTEASAYIQERNYELVHGLENSVVRNHKQFSDLVHGGATIEISIIIKSDSSFNPQSQICQRCNKPYEPITGERERKQLQCLRCKNKINIRSPNSPDILNGRLGSSRKVPNWTEASSHPCDLRNRYSTQEEHGWKIFRCISVLIVHSEGQTPVRQVRIHFEFVRVMANILRSNYYYTS
ncbi:hypothetical protein HGRIS_011125 [Hohenbuehelia grisea]|uniref:Ubiquitin-like domain-containing protein n=1 Tax=Hohenbuehelia grisea TaxID=104357 RepID=A0ABR3IZB5_9AGAR